MIKSRTWEDMLERQVRGSVIQWSDAHPQYKVVVDQGIDSLIKRIVAQISKKEAKLMLYTRLLYEDFNHILVEDQPKTTPPICRDEKFLAEKGII